MPFVFLFPKTKTSVVPTNLLNLFFFFDSVLQRAMRDWAVPLPCQDRRLRLGPNSGYSHHRQATEAHQYCLRQLHHQVGLELRIPQNFTKNNFIVNC